MMIFNDDDNEKMEINGIHKIKIRIERMFLFTLFDLVTSVKGLARLFPGSHSSSPLISASCINQKADQPSDS